MKTIRSTLLIGLACTSISLAGAEDNPAFQKDIARLQGEWSMVSGTVDGMAIPGAMLKEARRVCQGDEITVKIGAQLIMKAKITIDPSKTPKTIDFQVIDGPTKGKRQLGIYEVDGDTLKSCFAAPDAARPADFASAPGDHRTATVWKRAQEAAPKLN